MTEAPRSRSSGPASAGGVTDPLVDGAGGVFVLDRVFDRNAYRTNSAHVLLGSTAATNVLTVPAGYIAFFSGISYVNPTAGAPTVSIYAVADAVTAPATTDRVLAAPASASTETAYGMSLSLDEGWSLWAQAALAGVTVALGLSLIPKDTTGATLSVVKLGNLPAGDTVAYTGPAAGNVKYPLAGIAHSTAGANVQVTSKIYRAADAQTVTVGYRLWSAGGSNGWPNLSNNSGVLMPGDSQIISPAASGLNAVVLLCERPIAGITT